MQISSTSHYSNLRVTSLQEEQVCEVEARGGTMSVVHVNVAAPGSANLENYTLGDILICKAHRGKLQEVIYLLEEIKADINYRNQVRCASCLNARESRGRKK